MTLGSANARFLPIGALALCLLGYNTGASNGELKSTNQDADCSGSPIPESAIRKHVVELADDSYEGRGAGYPGGKKAAEYIARQFQEIKGLLPYGDSVKGTRSYFQEFRFQPQESPKPWEILSSRNVVAFLGGADDKLKEQVVVVGAHFDGQGRLGQANPDRLFPDAPGSKDDIWNSADDNASSVAVLIELARSFASLKPRRSILFIAFSAEEYGLNGSVAYVSAPAVAWGRHIAMINLEKLGRVPNQSLITASSSTSKMWEEVTARANTLRGMKVQSAISEIISDTDHYPFAAKGLPAITIGMAHQEDTHLPTDSADKISYDALAQRANYIRCFVELVADQGERPEFSGSLGRDLGLLVLIPSEQERKSANAEDIFGALKVSAVIPGLPASQAHLEEGDLIIGVDDVRLTSKKHPKSAVQDAADKAQGDSIQVTFVRKGDVRHQKIDLPPRSHQTDAKSGS